MASRETYEPIRDWSVEGRRRLVDEHGVELRLLLDEAFTVFVEKTGIGLAAFRFRGDDPTSEAVAWCIERFLTVDLDPSKLRAGSRSWRLFTEASFWLSQREGAAGYRRIVTRRVAPIEAADRELSPPAEAVPTVLGDLDAERCRERLVRGLRALRDRCCAALAGWWLAGTARLRRDVFAPEDPPSDWALAVAAEDDSTSKQRSFFMADALFRYLALLAGLVRDDGDEPHRACVRTWFSPCEDRPPYEVDRARVCAALGGVPSRTMTTLRHDGVTTLIRRCAELAGRPLDDASPRLEVTLARHSLRLSLLHRFKIDDAGLVASVEALREARR